MTSFGQYKLATSCGRRLEEIRLVHVVSVMYNLISSSGGSVGLSIGFDPYRVNREREVTISQAKKDNFMRETGSVNFFSMQNNK